MIINLLRKHYQNICWPPLWWCKNWHRYGTRTLWNSQSMY